MGGGGRGGGKSEPPDIYKHEVDSSFLAYKNYNIIQERSLMVSPRHPSVCLVGIQAWYNCNPSFFARGGWPREHPY